MSKTSQRSTVDLAVHQQWTCRPALARGNALAHQRPRRSRTEPTDPPTRRRQCRRARSSAQDGHTDDGGHRHPARGCCRVSRKSHACRRRVLQPDLDRDGWHRRARPGRPCRRHDQGARPTQSRPLLEVQGPRHARRVVAGGRVTGRVHRHRHPGVTHACRSARVGAGARRVDDLGRSHHLRHGQRGQRDRRARWARRRIGALRLHRLHRHRLHGLPQPGRVRRAHQPV